MSASPAGTARPQAGGTAPPREDPEDGANDPVGVDQTGAGANDPVGVDQTGAGANDPVGVDPRAAPVVGASVPEGVDPSGPAPGAVTGRHDQGDRSGAGGW